MRRDLSPVTRGELFIAHRPAPSGTTLLRGVQVPALPTSRYQFLNCHFVVRALTFRLARHSIMTWRREAFRR
jgi:hypothetical protein